VLVNNAAVNPHFGDLLDVTETVWDKLFDTNVKAAFLLSKEVVEHMRAGSSIVFVASMAAYNPPPVSFDETWSLSMIYPQGIMAYGVTKTAMIGLAGALAATLASRSIRVNSIAPGVIKTKFASAIVEADESSGRLTSSGITADFRRGARIGAVGSSRRARGLQRRGRLPRLRGGRVHNGRDHHHERRHSRASVISHNISQIVHCIPP